MNELIVKARRRLAFQTSLVQGLPVPSAIGLADREREALKTASQRLDSLRLHKERLLAEMIDDSQQKLRHFSGPN